MFFFTHTSSFSPIFLSLLSLPLMVTGSSLSHFFLFREDIWSLSSYLTFSFRQPLSSKIVQKHSAIILLRSYARPVLPTLAKLSLYHRHSSTISKILLARQILMRTEKNWRKFYEQNYALRTYSSPKASNQSVISKSRDILFEFGVVQPYMLKCFIGLDLGGAKLTWKSCNASKTDLLSSNLDLWPLVSLVVNEFN